MILESQWFIRHINEELTDFSELIKIAHALFKGNRKIDLPWSECGVAPDVSNTVPATHNIVLSTDFILIFVVSIQAQIDHAPQKIIQAKVILCITKT